MIHEKPDLLTDICDYTTLVYVIFRGKSSEWSESSIEGDLLIAMPCAIWSVDVAIGDNLLSSNTASSITGHLEYLTSLLIFVIGKTKLLCRSVICDALFLCP